MNSSGVLLKLGTRIKRLRLEKCITQSELAEEIEKDVKYIGDVEAGTCDLRFTEVVAIARKLGIPVFELFQ